MDHLKPQQSVDKLGFETANKLIRNSITNRLHVDKKPKTSGIDVFKTSLIKFVKDEIMEALVIVFNESFSDGQSPNIAKIAKVIPVLKGGEANGTNNYRPILLFSIFANY